MTPNPIEAVGCDESSVNNKEENLVKMNKKEDKEKKVCGEITFLFRRVFEQNYCVFTVV